MKSSLRELWGKFMGANEAAPKMRAKSSAEAPLRLRLYEKAVDAQSIQPALEAWSVPAPLPGQVVVEIAAAGVNPSDFKAALGMMPHAVFPRTPGRDFSGVVVAGEPGLIGKSVFGSSGELGIRRDGTHATHLVVEAAGVVEKPANLTLEEAAGIGVPFVTAMEGYRRAGFPQAGDTILIMGVNGKVGQAAAQIGCWLGAQVIGVVRRNEAYSGHPKGQVAIIDASSTDVVARVRELTGGKGANIVFNTVGEPYYEAGTKSLAVGGRQIFIASFREPVAFDIFAFYRGRHTYVGIDTLALSTVETADILRSLLPGFESGQLRPFPIINDAVYPLDGAQQAYAAVAGSAPNRILLVPRQK